MLASKQEGRSPISVLRRRLSMTQEEFAHAIGVTVSTVNRWENGHIEPSRLARKAMESLMARIPEASSSLNQTAAGMSAKELQPSNALAAANETTGA
jgi:DNA-binding XRE family transcriptional regulator